MESRQHHLQAITSQLKNKRDNREKRVSKRLQNRPKPEGVKRWRRKKGLRMEKCANVGSKQYLKQWAKVGLNWISEV
jgi:hypothetical protein